MGGLSHRCRYANTRYTAQFTINITIYPPGCRSHFQRFGPLSVCIVSRKRLQVQNWSVFPLLRNDMRPGSFGHAQRVGFMKIYATCFLPEASGSIAFPFCQAPGTASGSQKATALVQAPPTSLQIQTSLANTLLLSTAHVFTTVSQALVFTPYVTHHALHRQARHASPHSPTTGSPSWARPLDVESIDSNRRYVDPILVSATLSRVHEYQHTPSRPIRRTNILSRIILMTCMAPT